MVPYSELVQVTGRLVARQVVTIGAAALVAWYLDRLALAEGLLYGGGLAALLAIMLSANLQRAADCQGRQATAIMLRGAVERFLVLGLGVALAGALWELSLGGVVGGLIIAHLVIYTEAYRPAGTIGNYRTKSRIGE